MCSPRRQNIREQFSLATLIAAMEKPRHQLLPQEVPQRRAGASSTDGQGHSKRGCRTYPMQCPIAASRRPGHRNVTHVRALFRNVTQVRALLLQCLLRGERIWRRDLGNGPLTVKVGAFSLLHGAGHGMVISKHVTGVSRAIFQARRHSWLRGNFVGHTPRLRCACRRAMQARVWD
jgi:hypothetical protein